MQAAVNSSAPERGGGGGGGSWPWGTPVRRVQESYCGGSPNAPPAAAANGSILSQPVRVEIDGRKVRRATDRKTLDRLRSHRRAARQGMALVAGVVLRRCSPGDGCHRRRRHRARRELDLDERRRGAGLGLWHVLHGVPFHPRPAARAAPDDPIEASVRLRRGTAGVGCGAPRLHRIQCLQSDIGRADHAFVCTGRATRPR